MKYPNEEPVCNKQSDWCQANVHTKYFNNQASIAFTNQSSSAI